MTHEETIWRAASRAPLSWRQWGDEAVVFHPDSGDTHLLDALAAEILRRLESAPASRAALLEHLSRRPRPPVANDLEEAVTSVLQVFEEVGLIEPVHDPA